MMQRRYTDTFKGWISPTKFMRKLLSRPNTLSALSSCHQLRVLTLEISGEIHLHDSGIAQLVSDLTHLTTLTIKAYGSFLTLRALASIANSCPSIETISLPVDPTQGLDATIPHPRRALKSIDFDWNTLLDEESTRALGPFIRRLSCAEKFSYWGLAGFHMSKLFAHEKEESEQGKLAEKPPSGHAK